MKRWGIEPKEGRSWLSAAKIQFHSAGYESENDADIVFWQVFCRLNDGAATKWLLSSVWWSLIVKLLWQRWSWFSNALTAQGVKYCHSCSAAGFTEWCPLVSFWSQCSNNGWQETTVLFQRATVSASGGWTSEDGERYSAVCQENVVCVGSFVPLVFAPQCVWMLLTVLTFTSWAGSALRLG